MSPGPGAGIPGSGPGRRVVHRHPEAPPAVRWIVRTLEDAGFETWAVGGAVRDVLLGVPALDWDFATRAHPGQVRRLFRRTVPVGIEHGTVGVLARDGTLYEVTTFRRDVETYGRKARVVFADTLEEDLARRDFTINAVAWHPLRAAFADPYGGVDDLEAGVLRTVGVPAERFREDYLRVLRALRFAGRFGLTIHPPTWKALCSATGRLDGLSRERVREELMKVLGGDERPSGALALYAVSGVQAALFPELEALVGVPRPGSPLDAWTHSLLLADRLPVRRPLLRLAALLQPLGLAGGDDGGPGDASGPGSPAAVEGARRAAGLLVRLRFSNAHADRVAGLVEAGMDPPLPDAAPATLRRWLSRVGPDRLPDLARLWIGRARLEAALGVEPVDAAGSWRALRRELRGGPSLTVGELALDGRDLIALGMTPGPRFGRVLDALLERVLDDPSLNDPDTLARLALEWAQAHAGTEEP